MKLQKLSKLTKKAINDFFLIKNGDKIALGLSCGKDSLTMLYIFYNLINYYKYCIYIEVIVIDIGYLRLKNINKIKKICNLFNFHITIIKTNIINIVFNKKKEKNPCSLCSKIRKGILNIQAKKLNCNKISYAHHKDDLIETFFLSLFFEGRFHIFYPKTYLNKIKLILIRPLIYINEIDIIKFKNKYKLPVEKNTCPIDAKLTNRQYIKILLKKLSKKYKEIKLNIFNMILKNIKNI